MSELPHGKKLRWSEKRRAMWQLIVDRGIAPWPGRYYRHPPRAWVWESQLPPAQYIRFAANDVLGVEGRTVKVRTMEAVDGAWDYADV